MKVALVTPYSWTTPGGVNAHVGALAQHLRGRGHEVRILAPADGDVEPGIISLGRTVRVPFNGSVARLAFGPRIAGRVRVALRRAHADVVHVHEPFAPSVAMLAATVSRVPVVATFHTAADSARMYRAARMPLHPLWRKIAVRLAVSEAARSTVEGVFGPGVRIVPNGVEHAAYAAVPPAAPGAHVLFFGRLERRKGAHVLIEAIPRLRELVPDVRVTFAGDGPLRAQLEGAVAPEDRHAVSFLGRFDEEQRVALLGASTVVALPAIGGESFGYTLVEAMAAGRACVASAIPGYAGLLRDGIDGVLVPPGEAPALADAIASLLGDHARTSAMGAAARERARRYDWPIVTAQIEEAYREAMAEPRRHRRARRRPLDGSAAEPSEPL